MTPDVPLTPAQPSHRLRREVLATLGIAAGVVLFSLLLLWHDPTFFYHDDVQSGVIPAFAEIGRIARGGEWPLLGGSCWFASNFAGELPVGMFSLFILPLIVLLDSLHLSIPATAAAYSIVHMVILATGAFRLARQRGLSFELATLVALAATLNGWTMAWSASTWLPILTSFAWLPWTWWAMTIALESRAPGPLRLLPAGVFLYLLLSAGWPLTIVMIAIVTVWLVARHWSRRRSWRGLLSAWPLAVVWGIGMGLSAPAWLSFLAYLPNTVRATTGSVLQFSCTIPPGGLFGLILPTCASVWNIFSTHKWHMPIELVNGVVPAVAIVAALALHRRAFWKEARWELGLLGLALLLCMLPMLGNFRYSFRWLPLFHLLAGLTGALALEVWRRESRAADARGNLGLWALGLLAISWLWAMSRPALSPLLDGLYLGLLALWTLLERRPLEDGLRRWAPVGVATASMLSCYYMLPTDLEVPVWNIPETVRQAAPFSRDVRYISLAHYADYYSVQSNSIKAREGSVGQIMRFSNLPMHAGVEFVNGYSAMPMKGVFGLFYVNWSGFFNPALTQRLATQEAGPEGLLQRLGIDGIQLSRSTLPLAGALRAQGWQQIAAAPEEGAVFHRPGPRSPRLASPAQALFSIEDAPAIRAIYERKTPEAPWVVTGEIPAGPDVRHFAPSRLRPLGHRSLSEAAEVENPSSSLSSLVIFRRPWQPGFQARLDGKELPVYKAQLTMPAVILPPGASGRLELFYRPAALGRGLAIAGVTLGGILGLLLLGLAQRRRHPALTESPSENERAA